MKHRELPIGDNTQLIVTGSIAVDTIKFVDQDLTEAIRPDIHPVIAVSFLVSELEKQRGGTGANIAYSLALHGISPILLASLNEHDTQYVEYLRSMGVNMDFVHYSESPTSAFDVVTDTKNNQVATFYVGAMGDSESLTLIPWGNKDVFAIISAHDPHMMYQQTQECVKHNIPYCFDIGQQTNNDNKTQDLIPYGVMNATILIANQHEMAILAEKIGVTSQEMIASVPIAITTLGKDGALIEGSRLENPLHIPAAPISGVVDPTGAGDAWRAGFFAGLARNESLYDAGLRGAVSAAYCVEQKGGQNHFYTPEEFEARLEDFKNTIPGR